MSDLMELRDERPQPRRRKRSGRKKALAVLFLLLLVAALVVGALFAGSKLVDRLGGSDAQDFSGEGSGEVVVQVEPGNTAGDVADTLVEEGVVASRAAFFEVAAGDPRSTGLQPGFYRLRMEMSSAAALELLLDPTARVVGRVTIPEGRTVEQTLEALAEGTEIPLADYQAAAADPAALGLPEYAAGQLEGFLFPATYDVEPGTTAADVLTLMVDRFKQAAETVGLEEGAERLGYTPYEIVIVASLIEREVRVDDEYGQVARVVYNRLEQGIPLGIDAAVLFGVGKTAGGEVTASDLAADTPYENRRQTGLPPTPIASPGEATLAGALAPVDGDILYYVLATEDGRSFFTSDYNEFLRQRDKSRAEGIF
ncbi:MAG: endolytic transglycosylase MltG [Frankiaceae bacterium]|nr:endolytic transglycosylase MltG [Frankiaceae bacterium]